MRVSEIMGMIRLYSSFWTLIADPWYISYGYQDTDTSHYYKINKLARYGTTIKRYNEFYTFENVLRLQIPSTPNGMIARGKQITNLYRLSKRLNIFFCIPILSLYGHCSMTWNNCMYCPLCSVVFVIKMHNKCFNVNFMMF